MTTDDSPNHPDALNPHHIGILAMEVYTPSVYLEQSDLEQHMGVAAGKYTAGLGQHQMGVVQGDVEDIHSICLTVVKRLLEQYQLDPSQIGRLEVGTETLVDKSKSTKTVLMELFPHTNVEGATVINACYGGTAALWNAVLWCHWNATHHATTPKTKYAIVVAADIAVYEAGPARPTSGMGAVAVLVGTDAPLAVGSRTTHASHTWDFAKPNPLTEYPIVHGALSQTCYYRALEDVYQQWKSNTSTTTSTTTTNEPDYWIFHAPYNKLVQKSYARLVYLDALTHHQARTKPKSTTTTKEQQQQQEEEKKESTTAPLSDDDPLVLLAPWLDKPREETYTDKALEQVLKQISAPSYQQKVSDSNYVSQRVGNTYTASVFLGLASWISRVSNPNPHSHLAVFSYGSGAMATLYSLHVRQPTTQSEFTLDRMKSVLNLTERLDAREQVAAHELDRALDTRAVMHRSGAPYTPRYNPERLEPGTYYLTHLDAGWRRHYARRPTTGMTPVWDGVIRPLGPPARVPSFAQDSGHSTACYITGIAAGLPGQDQVFQSNNMERLLDGENCIQPVPTATQQSMLDKNIVLVEKKKSQGGTTSSVKVPLSQQSDMIQLAAQLGSFDLTERYGVPAGLAQTMDVAAQVAVAAGLEALRHAGLVSGTTNHPDDWKLPRALQDETGVVYASSFPAMDAAIGEVMRYFASHSELDCYKLVNGLRQRIWNVQGSVSAEDEAALQELLQKGTSGDDTSSTTQPYTFDRKFLFRVLVLGNAQLAQLAGCKGPNTQTNAACAGTTQAIAMAQDMLVSGRAARVVVIAGDNAAGPTLLPWLGSGFRVLGAATCQSKVEEAALPFDKRRSGMLLGAGGIGLVLETAASARKRQISVTPNVRLLATQYSNSAFHGAALDRVHIGSELKRFLHDIEDKYGITKSEIAAKGVYFSHETCTHASDASSCAGNEVAALRDAFGDEDLANLLIVNTKGFTGHPMGVSFEDVTAVAVLQQQRVPKLPNHQVHDDYLGPLKLSPGGPYECTYALRFAAGFGSQVAFALYVKV